MTSEAEVNWTTMAQLEQCRAAKINSIMQSITAVPVFDGNSGDLEFFLKRMDQIVNQISHNPLDESTNSYLLGYFYSRFAFDVLKGIGAKCDTPWDEVKRLLREKFGGAARSIPRLIVREVLIPRTGNESPLLYAQTVLEGFRKVSSRLSDAHENADEARIRAQMVEDIAQEVIWTNLPRRVKQWVRITKPQSLETLIKTIEEEEYEEKEERWEAVYSERSRRTRPSNATENGWKRGERRIRERNARPVTENRPRYREEKRHFRRADTQQPQAVRRGCFECGEMGHFARECPYIYRRAPTRVVGHGRGEPMEVNTLKTERRRRGEQGYYSTGEDTMSESDASDRRENLKSRPRGRSNRDEWPALPQSSGIKEQGNKGVNE